MPMRSLAHGSVLALVGVLTACEPRGDTVVYVCEEPLAPYLRAARDNIANDYAVERSSRVLEYCPEQGFHRRYVFSFQQVAVVSEQPAQAEIEAAWCSDDSHKSTSAELKVLPNHLVFHFNYPWSTATGKYPRTEFRLNRTTLRGGFFEDLAWQCELRKTPPDSPPQ